METYIIDLFTDKPFSGNPAGVCITSSTIGEAEMLLVAQELTLSETAFLQPIDGTEDYSIRFFSPVMEIPLCGHATLAAAKVLFDKRDLTTVNFVNINGLVLAARESNGQIVMEFPVYETHTATVPPALLAALGLNSVENCVFNEETRILLLEIKDSRELAALAPNFNALQESHDSINGVLVTALSGDDEYDFHSRYFWPWSGTNEDPVTGGTHTFLAKYWMARLGKSSMRSYQSSQRTGFMQVDLVNDKVLITGQAQLILEGVMHI